MKEDKIAELIGLMEKHTKSLDYIMSSLKQALDQDIKILGRTANAALIVAGLLENYYTCLETIYIRISQYFENDLTADRWHTDLLEKMTLHIEGVRVPVVSEKNYRNLLELLKFRHFKRYYFETEYDWDRLDFLMKKLNAAHPQVHADLESFKQFLRKI